MRAPPEHAEDEFGGEARLARIDPGEVAIEEFPGLRSEFHGKQNVEGDLAGLGHDFIIEV